MLCPQGVYFFADRCFKAGKVVFKEGFRWELAEQGFYIITV